MKNNERPLKAEGREQSKILRLLADMISAGRSNSYVKILLAMLVFAGIGGCIGWGMAQGDFDGAAELFAFIQRGIQENFLPVMCGMVAVTLAAWVFFAVKIREYGRRFLKEEDEEKGDFLEYRLSIWSTWSVIFQTVVLIGSLLCVSMVYQEKFLRTFSGSRGSILVALLLFIVECILCSLWQIHYVKQVQRIYPEKKGDPSGLHFRRQWMESCDEAEQEIIYQASYRSYTLLLGLLPCAAVVAMISHLVWNTGLLAVAIVCFLWLIQVVSYSIQALRLQRSKLNK